MNENNTSSERFKMTLQGKDTRGHYNQPQRSERCFYNNLCEGGGERWENVCKG